MPFDIKNFKELVDLETIGPDMYIGLSPYYHFGHVYGGQVVAQSLRAAFDTVAPSLHVHSLHAYFIRRGNFDEPIRYEVDRIRNGRSFSTRRVVAHQAAGPILNLSTSFQVREDQPDVQECFPRPDTPAPQDVKPLGWGQFMEQRPILEEDASSGLTSWIRVNAELNEDTVLQTCALAFASDDFPIDAARLPHPQKLGTSEEEKSRFVTASLDHSIWFHRMGRSDDWTLHEYRPYSLSGARGLAIGQVFDIKGVHMATIAQEALIREKSPNF